MTELSEALGFERDDRVVIINCDDLGMSHSSNIGCYEAVRNGIASSMSLMVPAPWARDAAVRYRGEDVGVHLTLNAEYDAYRWGPITRSPSLFDGIGGFPKTIEDIWDHADLDEVLRECRAQIERAVLWGFDVSHLDSHMGTLQLRPEFFDIYLELAFEFRLPIRMGNASDHELVGFPYRDIAQAEGAIFPDHFVYVGVGSRANLTHVAANLRPGVTEVYVHPAVRSDELFAIGGNPKERIDDLEFVLKDGDFDTLLQAHNAHVIGWRPLQALARDQHVNPRQSDS